MNRIAIIGANEAINHAILKAKEMGYETHVFAWQNGDIGEKTADFFYPISIADKEKVLEICKRIKPIAIVSITSDFAVRTVNFVARGLGLTCNSEKTDIYATNKYKMRSAFKEAGIPTPWFIEVGESFSLDDVRDVKYPLIVKPIDR
jgi:formate-dependent phosphoribosylglycinamide formyltransferase (GAR transformylase)